MEDNELMEVGKQYYKIQEAAEIIGVPKSTLRFWEKEFPELNPMRTSTNRRLYNPTQMELLKALRYLLRVKGLKIDAARAQLHRNPQTITRQQQIMEGLMEVRDELTKLLGSLKKRR